MELKLSHAPNPDIKTGYWSDMKRPKPQRITVTSLQNASEKSRQYITFYDLGAGNWTGGQVYKNGKQIADISYNGRIWDMTGKEIVIPCIGKKRKGKRKGD